MQSSTSDKSVSRLARAMLWSIQYQDQIAQYFRIFIGTAAVIVGFMGVVGILSLDATLYTIFLGGLFLAGGAWLLIEQRRAWLLNIQDPELKQLAYSTMLAYLAVKGQCCEEQLAALQKSREENDGAGTAERAPGYRTGHT